MTARTSGAEWTGAAGRLDKRLRAVDVAAPDLAADGWPEKFRTGRRAPGPAAERQPDGARLFALAQALTNDYEQFEALVEGGDAASGGGEVRE